MGNEAVNVIDQILHVVVFGVISFVGSAVTGCAAVVAYELCDWYWDVGPITIGQWPPGDTWWHVTTMQHGWGFLNRDEALDWQAQCNQKGDRAHIWEHQPKDRVEDLRTDLFFELAGVAIGQAGQIALLVVLL